MSMSRAPVNHLLVQSATGRSTDAITITIPLSVLAGSYPQPAPVPFSAAPVMSRVEKKWFQQQIETIRRKARKRGFRISKVRFGGFRVLDQDRVVLAGEEGDGLPIAEAWDFIINNTYHEPIDYSGPVCDGTNEPF